MIQLPPVGHRAITYHYLTEHGGSVASISSEYYLRACDAIWLQIKRARQAINRLPASQRGPHISRINRIQNKLLPIYGGTK